MRLRGARPEISGRFISERKLTCSLGEIEMKSGHAAEGRAALGSLAKEAQEHGFALIARKAQEAANGQTTGSLN